MRAEKEHVKTGNAIEMGHHVRGGRPDRAVWERVSFVSIHHTRCVFIPPLPLLQTIRSQADRI